MDILDYRRAETLAKTALREWRLPLAHMPPNFIDNGFPLRLESRDQLLLILDTMQEDRFDFYVQEMGGLNPSEIHELVDALSAFAAFHLATFPGKTVQLPLSTFLSQLVIALKLRHLRPRGQILEVGPGCGYLSYFISNDSEITRYHTIEVTESFYILQSLINAQIFQAQYQNHAQIDARGLGIAEMGPLEATEPNKKHYWAFEETSAIHVTRTPRMAQYPWWRLGDLVENNYDVITMNANLTEFSKAALFHYVEVVKRALKQDGFLFCHCQGGGTLDLPTIFGAFQEAGLRALAVLPGSMQETVGARKFVVSNFLFVRGDHSTLGAHTASQVKVPVFDPSCSLLRLMFGLERSGGYLVTRQEILGQVIETLGERTGLTACAAS